MHSQQYSDQAVCAGLGAACEHLMLGLQLGDWDPNNRHAGSAD